MQSWGFNRVCCFFFGGIYLQSHVFQSWHPAAPVVAAGALHTLSYQFLIIWHHLDVQSGPELLKILVPSGHAPALQGKLVFVLDPQAALGAEAIGHLLGSVQYPAGQGLSLRRVVQIQMIVKRKL